MKSPAAEPAPLSCMVPFLQVVATLMFSPLEATVLRMMPLLLPEPIFVMMLPMVEPAPPIWMVPFLLPEVEVVMPFAASAPRRSWLASPLLLVELILVMKSSPNGEPQLRWEATVLHAMPLLLDGPVTMMKLRATEAALSWMVPSLYFDVSLMVGLLEAPALLELTVPLVKPIFVMKLPAAEPAPLG